MLGVKEERGGRDWGERVWLEKGNTQGPCGDGKFCYLDYVSVGILVEILCNEFCQMSPLGDTVPRAHGTSVFLYT